MAQRVAKTTFYAPGKRTIKRGDVVAEDDPIIQGREHLFQPVERAVREPGYIAPTRRTQTEADPPPKAGPGSGLDAWRSYAEAKGVDVPDDASRDDIVALVG